jgi:antitoxin ParD1/3/4
MSAASETLSVTLPADLVRLVEAKVASGEYATQSDVVQDGLQGLMDRGLASEHWLRTEVAAAFDAHRREPTDVRPGDAVRAGLEKRFAARRAASRDL